MKTERQRNESKKDNMINSSAMGFYFQIPGRRGEAPFVLALRLRVSQHVCIIARVFCSLNIIIPGRRFRIIAQVSCSFRVSWQESNYRTSFFILYPFNSTALEWGWNAYAETLHSRPRKLVQKGTQFLMTLW